jgi:hypothetical protein
MDAFTLIVFGGIVVVVLVFLAIGFWHPARALEITDAARQESWAAQARIEERDVGEMVAAQNAYRRARGEEEITAADVERAAAERQRESLARSGAE